MVMKSIAMGFDSLAGTDPESKPTNDWIESCERAAVWNVAALGARLRMMMSQPATLRSIAGRLKPQNMWKSTSMTI
jgi:hypothetical protein